MAQQTQNLQGSASNKVSGSAVSQNQPTQSPSENQSSFGSGSFGGSSNVNTILFLLFLIAVALVLKNNRLVNAWNALWNVGGSTKK